MFGKTLAFLFMSAFVAMPQSVRLEPDLAVAQSEYLDAEQSWLRNDPRLEADLYKDPKDAVKIRIKRAAGLRDEVMQKKEVYLGLMVNRLDSIRAHTGNARASHLPTKELKQDLEREQAQLLTQQDTLDGMIKELREGDEYLLVRRAMEAERSDLISLQNNVALRIHGLDKIEKGQTAEEDLERSGSLDKNLNDIRNIWKEEHDRAVRARATWARYYSDLEKSLDHADGSDKKPAKPAQKTSTEPVHSDASAKVRENVAAAAISSPSQPFSGVWQYRSELGAWVGFGEPDLVTLQLRRVADHLEGNYFALLPGRDDMRTVSLALEGTVVSDREVNLTFVSQEPQAAGELHLQLSPDRRMLVERTRSNDSFIPPGMEVLRPQ